MSIADPQLVCTRPYEWFEIHRHGTVFMCCPAWLKRPIGNLLKQSITEIWNGPLARELRKSVINGSFHNCSKTRCPFLSAEQNPVQKLGEIASPTSKVAILNNLAQVPFPPQKLNLCFDHSCNLACPSCREQHLSLAAQEKLQIGRITDIIKEHLLPQAQEITMSGFGDPFASAAYLDILTSLNDQGEKGASLRLHSNGQLWTEGLWNRFNNLQQRVTSAEISVDAATSDTYLINRPGGSFSKLMTNLEFLARQPFDLTLSMVVQANNFTEVPLFIDLATKLQARVYLSQLVNWGTFKRTEFLDRAVHLPGHPSHPRLKEILAPTALLPHVDIGNLKPLITTPLLNHPLTSMV